MSASRFVEDKEQIRAAVRCAVVLEKHRDPWRLDVQESTRACLKYRRGAEVLLVNHHSRGWWDPTRGRPTTARRAATCSRWPSTSTPASTSAERASCYAWRHDRSVPPDGRWRLDAEFMTVTTGVEPSGEFIHCHGWTCHAELQ